MSADSGTITVSCVWTIKERVTLPISHREIWHPVLKRKNTFTNNGLTNLASAIGGGYTPPNYLVLESNYAHLVLSQNVGDTTVTLSARVDQPTDTDIALSIGLANQEVIGFTSVAQASDGVSWLYTLSSPLVNSHSINDQCARQVYATDTMAQVAGEAQYDSTNATNLRLQSVAGYSQGPGNWTTQFYFPANTAITYISHIGLTDNISLGTGMLHNHVIMGYDHTGLVSDVEIDGSLTLTN